MNQYYSRHLDPNLLSDLDITDTVFNLVDKTTTQYGKLKLKQNLTLMSTKNLPFLLHLNKRVHKDTNHRTKMQYYLDEINKVDDISQYWFGNDEEQDLYFKTNWLNNRYFLNMGNKLKFSNVFIMIMIYFVVYIFLYVYGFPISVIGYVDGIFQSYKMVSRLMVSMLIKSETIVNYLSHAVAYSYVGYQCYVLYNSVNMCLQHYYKCNGFSKKYEQVVKFVSIVEKIYGDDKFTRTKKVEKALIELKNYFETETHLGHNLVTRLYRKDYIKHFNTICNYVGKIDVRLMIAKLMDNGYSLPSINIQSEKPFLECTDMWHPIVGKEKSVPNSISINNNIIIITGPNQAGKSTLMRTLMLNVVLAQSLGISCCKKLYFTPFDRLYTYVNVPDSIGRESLFEAETNRCLDYLTKLNQNFRTLGIVDELFTGTQPLNGMCCTKAVVDSLKEHNNSITLLSTHFTEICDIKDVTYYKFEAIKKNGKYKFPYKMLNGVSNQHIAIELLKEKGYNQDIINKAIIYMKEYKTNNLQKIEK